MFSRYPNFVASTLQLRLPRIIDDVSAGLPAGKARQLQHILNVVSGDGVIEADSLGRPHWADWARRLSGCNALHANFLDTEFWFYQQILEASDWSATGVDPFGAVKWHDIESEIARADALLATIGGFEQALEVSLLGNKHDLSQLAGPQQQRLIQSLSPLDYAGNLHIICDNFGAELLADLILAVVATREGRQVSLHVKELPMFVSDATGADTDRLVDSGAGTLLADVRRQIAAGRLAIVANPLWSSPASFDQVPAGFFGVDPLVLSKGDLNYRRCIGDVVVAADTPFEHLPILPSVAMVCLRSVKSYCLAGVERAYWPEDIDLDDFPMTGSLFVPQAIPARVTPSP